MLKLLMTFCLSLSLISGPVAQSVHASSQGENSEQSLDQAFGNPTNLTDQEMHNANTFSHEGYRERKRKEACKENKVNCSSNAHEEGVLLNGGLEDHLGKGYTMIFGGLSFLGGGGPSIKTKEEVVVKDHKGNPVKQENGVTKTETKENDSTDYCMYAAMGWEMVSMLIQNNLNSNVEQETANIKDGQLRALVALKKNHQARQKTATMQAVAYSAVTTCYIYYATPLGGGAGDWKLWVKMAGAGLLATLYWVKVSKHAQAAELVQKVIDGLPEGGDCNPWTGTHCFCKEPTSKEMYPPEYDQVCVKKMALNDLPPQNLGCGAMNGGQMTFDKNCKCKETNTCFSTQVKAMDPKFSVGNNVLSTANKGFDLLGDGEYDHAKLSNYSTDARALALKSFPKKAKFPKVKLSDSEKKDAADLSKHMPAGLAAIAAKAPAGNSPRGLGIGSSAGLDKLPPESKEKVAEAIKAKYNQGSAGQAMARDEQPGFKMPTFGEQEQPDNGPEVLSFAEKAIDGADVNNAPDTPIFDIISNRYRRSGWNKVDSAEMNMAQ